jgi:uncharacterized protein (TIGR02145 family)
MKKFTYKTILSLVAVFLFSANVNAQMPDAISITPEGATAYDEITLTFNANLACTPDGKQDLLGLQEVFMHSAAFELGQPGGWGNYAVDFDATGANGQAPILTPNGDDTYSITFIPYDFYGFPLGTVITKIIAVFNNGSWDAEGKDYVEGGCGDFFIPLNYGLLPQHFNFEGGNPSAPFWTLYIAEATLSSIDLVAGDEIAIFDGDLMVGAMVLTQVCTPDNQFENVLMAFSTLAGGGQGYTSGNDVSFKCWDSSLAIEVSNFTISFDNPYGDAWTQGIFPSDDGEYSIVSLNWIYHGVLTGTITDAANSQPIEGALVTVEGTSYNAVTAPNGTYLIEDIETGIYSVTASIDGYHPETIAGVEILILETTTVNFNLSLSQNYNLVTGYQFVSSRLISENPDMQNILNGILDNLDFVRNTEGYMLRKIGPNWVNNIGDWVTTEGYLIRMNNADSFEITGEAIYEHTPIELISGYQIISYLSPEPLDCEEVFSDILDNLNFVRNTLGQMFIKIGPFWVNGIGDMQPCEGYLVKMNNADELIYSTLNYPPEPPSSPIPVDGAENQSIEVDISWTCTDPEGDPMTYDIYFGIETTPPQVATGQTETNYNPGTLEYNMEYFWKIVAHDDHDNTTEGPIWNFITEFVCGNPFIDPRSGQSYNTVQIGDQCWMAENLNIGTMINGIEEMTDNGIIEKYCYDDNPANCEEYGGLYLWDEMMQYTTTQGVQGICPSGWHLPSDEEWTILTDFLGGQWDAGGKMKEVGTTHWNPPNTGATNQSGFTGLPGGQSYTEDNFTSLGYLGSFWSSSEHPSSHALNFKTNMALYIRLHYDNDNVSFTWGYKDSGYSGRCVLD